MKRVLALMTVILMTFGIFGPGVAEDESNGSLNGPVRLDVTVDFRKNVMFSRYDVDMYLDDERITTMAHGTGYQETFEVTKGIHVITFRKKGDATIQGIAQFNVDENTSFSCSIECKRNKIDVTKESIGSGNRGSSMSREEYAAACKTLVYKEIERNPNTYKGYKTRVSGKVIQVTEGWFDSVKLRVRDSNTDVWYVTYTREKGEPRILENDQVEIYGECTGVQTYSTLLGGRVTIPAVDAMYIDIK